MTGVMLLIGDVLFSSAAAVLIAGSAAAVFALFWWVLPLAERRRSGSDYGPMSRGIPDERSPEPTYRREP